MNPTRVLLADDHRLVRAGIRSLLDAIEGVHVVAEADDGSTALELARKHRPDVVFTDIAMQGMNGLELLARLRKELPGTRVAILSMHADEAYVERALKDGAAAYLLKDATVAELETALEAVVRGESYLSPAVSRVMIEAYKHERGASEEPLAALSPRQREVLRLIAEGSSTKQIAYRLGLSVKTVETHRAQIAERLGIRDVAGLVRFAVRTGIVSADK